jgi:queuosine precursor transporter
MKDVKFHHFDIILGLYIFGVIVSQLMGAKTVQFFTVFGLSTSISIAIFVMPLLFTLTDVVVEVYGKERARSMVFTGMLIVVLLTAFTVLATALPPGPRSQWLEPSFDMVFTTSLRFAAAAIAAYAASELLDVLIFSQLRKRMHGKALWFRNNISNFIAQFVDSTVFVVIAFYSFNIPFTENFTFLIGIILPYWAVRCLLSIFETPLVYLGVYWLRDEKAVVK